MGAPKLGIATIKRPNYGTVVCACGVVFQRSGPTHRRCPDCADAALAEGAISQPEIPAAVRPLHDWLCDNPMHPDWHARHAEYQAQVGRA